MKQALITKIIVGLIFCLSIGLKAQQNKIVGVWEMTTEGARKLQMELSISEHKGEFFGEFNSAPIGRGSFNNISFNDGHLTFDLKLGTNFMVVGDLKLETANELNGKITIYGTPVPVKGILSSKKVDRSAIEGEPSWSPDGKAVAFTFNKYGNKDIVIVWLDGSVINVTEDAADDYGSAWSPDGNKLAFISNRSGSDQIYIYSLKSGEIKQLTTAKLEYDFVQWSPNGEKIIFSTPNGPSIISSDGLEIKNLTSDNIKTVYARFSPNGKQVSVTLVEKNIYNIAVIDVENLEIKNLTNSPLPDFNQRWSPDGKKLLWISRRDGNPEVYIMNVDGSHPMRLTNNMHKDNNPSWSPNSEKVIWESRKTDKSEVLVMNADGSDQINISNHEGHDINPVWSPNGEKILFISEREGNPKIFIVNNDGTGVYKLTKTVKRD